MKKNKAGINAQMLIMKVAFAIILVCIIAILFYSGKKVVNPYENFTTTWFNIILAGWKSLVAGEQILAGWFGGISLLVIFSGKPVPTAKQTPKNPDTPIFPDTPVPVKNAADCVECHDDSAAFTPSREGIAASFDYGMQERRSAHEYEHQLKQLESQLECGLITKEEYRELKARYKS